MRNDIASLSEQERNAFVKDISVAGGSFMEKLVSIADKYNVSRIDTFINVYEPLHDLFELIIIACIEDQKGDQNA